jgi:23S rRNA (guanosine2251-2'-O)-methyltransferase
LSRRRAEIEGRGRGGEWCYGVHAVSALLGHDPGRIVLLWLARGDDPRRRELHDQALAAGVAVARCTREELDERVGDVRHQGVAAWCRQVRADADTALAWEELLDRLPEQPFLLVLDGIQDPHNLGACLRSAAAAGVDAVIAPRDRAVGLTPAARKVASGAAERVPFVQVTNLVRALDALRERGVWVVGTEPEAEGALWDVDLRGPLALVVGNEGAGMRRLVGEHCDIRAHLPMANAMESLNASVAVGICLFEAVRQRRVRLSRRP